MKKIFSGKLYLDGLSKTKFFGIISIILTAVLSCFVAIVVATNSMTYESFQIIETTDFVLPTAIILLLAPFSVYLQFSFLNKRSSSDFYHAIPFTRIQLCLSYFASVITWIAAAILVPVILCSAIYILCPFTSFEASVPFLCFFGYFGAAILLMSLMLIAMSLTGTAVSNVLVFGIITLFFRLIFFIFTIIFEQLVPICNINSMLGAFLKPEFFLPIQILFMENVFGNTASIIYAYAIAVICTVCGTFLFIRRHSESADKSAVSKAFQTVFRCAVSIPTAILAVISFADIAFYNSSIGFDDIFYIFLFLIITLIIYFLYEIITTKGISTLLKTLPQLGIVFAAAFIFWGSVAVTENYIYSFEPTAEELKSISLSLDNYSSNSYEELQTSSISITDPDALKLASNILRNSIDASRNNNFYSHQYSMHTSLKFNTQSNKGVVRNLAMSETEYDSLQSVLLESKEYQDAQLLLPNDNEILSIFVDSSIIQSSVFDPSLREDINNCVWQSFKDEYMSLSVEDKTAVKNSESQCIVGTIIVYGTLDGNTFTSNYDISDLMPKTAELLVSCCENSQDVSKVEALSDNFKNDVVDYDYYYIDAYLYDLKSSVSYNIYYDYSSDNKNNKQNIINLISALEPCYSTKPTINSPIITLLIASEENYNYENYSITFSATSEAYENILSLLGVNEEAVSLIS